MQNQQFINRLERLEQEMAEIKKILKKNLPAYGSNDWWGKEISTGEEQIKKGQFRVYKNAESMVAQLHKGK